MRAKVLYWHRIEPLSGNRLRQQAMKVKAISNASQKSTESGRVLLRQSMQFVEKIQTV